MTEEDSILVVDDEPGLADLYSDLLAPHYDVLVAYDGRSALDKIDNGVDVVLLDRHMPEMTGDEVLEYIRRDHPQCMVAFVTGIDPDDNIVTTDIDMYLQKPLQPDELRSAVKTLLQRQKFNREEQILFGLVEKMALLGEQRFRSELSSTADIDRIEQVLPIGNEQPSLSSRDRAEIQNLLA